MHEVFDGGTFRKELGVAENLKLRVWTVKLELIGEGL
jgi:hypothetical protein